MNKFDRFKNELYSKLPAIFFILLFVAYMVVSMDQGHIDHFFGFPDVVYNIDDEQSELLDYCIDYHAYNKNWEITDVYIRQHENRNVILIHEGEYNNYQFTLHQYINISSFDGKYEDTENRHFQELYLDSDHPDNEINTYCYLITTKNSEIHVFTGCTLIQVTDEISQELNFEIERKLTKQEAIQITDELKSMMQNPSP